MIHHTCAAVGRDTLVVGIHLLSELDDQRQLVGLHESQNVFFGHLSLKGVTAFIELQEDIQRQTSSAPVVCWQTPVIDSPQTHQYPINLQLVNEPGSKWSFIKG